MTSLKPLRVQSFSSRFLYTHILFASQHVHTLTHSLVWAQVLNKLGKVVICLVCVSSWIFWGTCQHFQVLHSGLRNLKESYLSFKGKTKTRGFSRLEKKLEKLRAPEWLVKKSPHLSFKTCENGIIPGVV